MKAVYAGSFDPFTLGHLNVYYQARELFDEVHILIASNPGKNRMFNTDAMIAAIKESGNIDSPVIHCTNLVADYCRENEIKHLVRGLRNTSDYMYEEEVAKANQLIYPEIKTVYFRAENDISSTLVKTLLIHGKDIRKYVPNAVYSLIKDLKN